MLNLHTTTQLPPVGKEYMCFHDNGKLPSPPGVLNQVQLLRWLIMLNRLINLNKNVLFLKACCNHRVLNIMYIPLILNNT